MDTRLTTRRRSARRPLAGILMLALVALAACGGGGATGGDSGGEGELTTVNVGVLPIADVAPLYVGIKQGFFKEEGLKVEPQIAQAGAAITTGVVSGDYDIGFASAIIMILANGKGLPVQIITTGNQAALEAENTWAGLMVKEDGPIQEPKDLEGKTIAVNALEGTVQLTVLAALKKEGVDTSKLEFFEVPFPDMPATLDKGEVPAAGAVEPFVTSIEQHGGKNLVPYLYDIEPGMTIGTYFTHDRTIQEQPDLIKRFATAMNRSLDYSREHKQAARDAIASYTKIPPEVLPEIALPLWSSDLKPDTIQLQADLAQEFGFTEQRVEASEIIWDGATGG